MCMPNHKPVASADIVQSAVQKLLLVRRAITWYGSTPSKSGKYSNSIYIDP